jgi:hypothetical protein
LFSIIYGAIERFWLHNNAYLNQLKDFYYWS